MYCDESNVMVHVEGTFTINGWDYTSIIIDSKYKPRFSQRVPAQSMSDWTEQCMLTSDGGAVVFTSNLNNFNVNCTFFYPLQK